MTTRAQAIAAAGESFAEAELALHYDGTVAEAARRAHRPGGPSIPELEARIRALREAPATSPDVTQGEAAYRRRRVSVPPPANHTPLPAPAAGRTHNSKSRKSA